jgi:protein LTV1
LEESLPFPESNNAALYGIFYDDTEYDYLQHLRPVGIREEGVESYLIEAPSSSRKKEEEDVVSLEDLPPETLPPKFELLRNYESEEAVPSSISGFQPNMDPHLRQVLEALEDEAFVDDQLQDDFFHELTADGERRVEDVFEHEFETGETENHGRNGEPKIESAGESWEERFQRFKIQQEAAATESEGDQYSEKDDTIGSLPVLSVIGRKWRKKAASNASGFSMSSSSIYRNDALQTLDDRFDRVGYLLFRRWPCTNHVTDPRDRLSSE